MEVHGIPVLLLLLFLFFVSASITFSMVIQSLSKFAFENKLCPICVAPYVAYCFKLCVCGERRPTLVIADFYKFSSVMLGNYKRLK